MAGCAVRVARVLGCFLLPLGGAACTSTLVTEGPQEDPRPIDRAHGAPATAPAATEAAAEPPPSVSPSRISVCLVPMGEFDASALPVIALGMQVVFGFTVRTLEAIPMPEDAWYPPRRRYRADAIIDFLSQRYAPDGESQCDYVQGLTSHDISTTKGNVRDWGNLGLGYIGRSGAVTSTHRLRRHGATEDVFIRRLVTNANHELGHNLGIRHVPNNTCLMSDAFGSVRNVDMSSAAPCPDSVRAIELALDVVLPSAPEMPWDELVLLYGRPI